MAEVKHPSGTVLTVPDGSVGRFVTYGFTAVKSEPAKPVPAKKAAPRKRADAAKKS